MYKRQTYTCNHKCKFCYCPWEQSSYPLEKELTISEWENAIDILLNNGVEQITFSGGEALMKDGFAELLKYVVTKQKCKSCSIISNGLLINDEWLMLFKKYGVQLAISFPGYDTFKWHTGINGADNILEKMKKAKEIGIKVTASITATRQNIHELHNVISLTIKNGASNILLNRFMPGGRGITYLEELKLSTKQVNEMLQITEAALKSANIYGRMGTTIPLCSIYHPTQYEHLKIGYRCAAAKRFFAVDPSGRIRVCNHSPRIVGYVFNPTLITDREYWNLYLESNYHPTECQGCMAKYICDCGCREVSAILSGSPRNRDQSLTLDKREFFLK